MWREIELTEGDTEEVRIRLQKRDNAGRLVPAGPLGTLPTAKLLIEDETGEPVFQQALFILQDDDDDCIVGGDVNNAKGVEAYPIPAGRYRAKVTVTKDSGARNVYPPGDEFFPVLCAPDPDPT